MALLIKKTSEAQIQAQTLQSAGENSKKECCRAVKNLLKTCIIVSHFIQHDFSLTFDEAATRKEYDLFFQQHPQVLSCLSALTDGASKQPLLPEYTPQYFVDNYLNYHVDDQEMALNLDVVEFVRPPEAAADKASTFKKEVTRLNRQHWSEQLAIISYGHLQTINHKFETWQQIKSVTGQIRFTAGEGEDDVAMMAQDLPMSLFQGAKCHDLGTILLTETHSPQEKRELESRQ